MVTKWEEQGLGTDDIDVRWNSYVPTQLLGRLCGFELLMAPYAIAHLKVGLKLYETGYHFANDERVRIFLTNSLEPAEDFSDRMTYAVPALAHEAHAVNLVKAAGCFTIVIGNPPYFAEAGRGGEWIAALMRGYDASRREATHDYFKVDGASLGERTTKWINDDYVKFLRLSERTIEIAGIGIVAMITNHSYLDNPTFRGVRESLVDLFGYMKVLDLHGNSTKKERAPNGAADENVFEIRQGVAIAVMAREPARVVDGEILCGELWGSRQEKYERLSRPGGLEWRSLTPSPPNYLLVDQDTEVRTEFLAWPSIAEIFPLHNHGVITKRDGLALQFTEAEVWKVVQDFVACPSADAYQRFGLADDVRDWSVDSAKRDLIASGPTADHIRRLCYRPFNYRFTYYTGRARGFIGWPVERVMRHMLATRNIAIVTTRQTKDVWGLLATRDLAGHKACSGYDVNTVFPLYLVGESDDLGLFSMADSGEPAESSRAPNLDPAFVRRIVDLLGGSGAPGSEAERDADSGPEGVLGYVYGVLHSPEYRRRYVDALRSDYAHVPVPAKRDLYVELTRLGAELLDLHLLESPRLSQPVTKYIGSATPEVVRVAWSDGTVWLDADTAGSHRGTAIGRSGFAGVPEEVWRFHIGGFQVCDKWLKDRVGRVLSAADLAQFQQIVVALSETIRLMGEIDETVNRHGGWPGAFATA